MQRKNIFTQSGYIAHELYHRFRKHGISSTAGQIAYFFILSVFPFIIFTNALVASFNIPSDTAVSFLRPFFPEQIVSFISQYLEYINIQNSRTTFSIGVIIALFSSSKSVRSLIRAFNLAYGINHKCGLFRQILFSMLFMLVFALVFIICIIIIALGNELISSVIKRIAPGLTFNILFILWRWITMALVIFAAFTASYKFLPSAKIKIRDALPGAYFSLVGFLILIAGFSFYVNCIASDSLFYGTIGAVLLLMLWMYFVGMILLSGAELNKIIYDMKKID